MLGSLRAARAGLPHGSVGGRSDGRPHEVDLFVGLAWSRAVTVSTLIKRERAELVLHTFSTAVCAPRTGLLQLDGGDSATTRAARPDDLILVEATGAAEAECREALTAADGDLKAALVSLVSGAAVAAAREALDRSADEVRGALALLG